NRASVEQDQIGLIAGGRLGVSERLEHSLHALGVVLVHLAAERGYVIEPHHGQGYRGGSAAPVDSTSEERCQTLSGGLCSYSWRLRSRLLVRPRLLFGPTL